MTVVRAALLRFIMVFRCHGYTSSSPAIGGTPPTACNSIIRGRTDFDCACSEPPRSRWSLRSLRPGLCPGFEANLRDFMILIPFGLLSQLDGSIRAGCAFVADAAGKKVICCPNHTVDRPHPPIAPVAFFNDEDFRGQPAHVLQVTDRPDRDSFLWPRTIPLGPLGSRWDLAWPERPDRPTETRFFACSSAISVVAVATLGRHTRTVWSAIGATSISS